MKTEEEKAADRAARAKLQELVIEQIPVFIDHFGNLDELITIRHVLQELVAEAQDLRALLDERLQVIAVALAGGR